MKSRLFIATRGFSEDEISVRTFNEMNFSLYDTENRNLKLLAIFTLLTLLLTILAMFAMSTYYARQHAREAALRKVMGSSRLQLFVETSAGLPEVSGNIAARHYRWHGWQQTNGLKDIITG